MRNCPKCGSEARWGFGGFILGQRWRSGCCVRRSSLIATTRFTCRGTYTGLEAIAYQDGMQMTDLLHSYQEFFPNRPTMPRLFDCNHPTSIP